MSTYKSILASLWDQSSAGISQHTWTFALPISPGDLLSETFRIPEARSLTDVRVKHPAGAGTHAVGSAYNLALTNLSQTRDMLASAAEDVKSVGTTFGDVSVGAGVNLDAAAGELVELALDMESAEWSAGQPAELIVTIKFE